jgi:hypothetical protein
MNGRMAAARWSLLGGLAVLLALVLAVSGCSAQAGIESRVEEDGSGEVLIRMEMDQGLTDIVGERLPDLGLTNAAFEDLVGRFTGDWEVTSGQSEDGGRWLEASQAFTDPQDYQRLVAQNQVLASVFDTESFSLTQEQDLFKTRTVFRSEADAAGAAQELQGGLGPVDLGTVVQVEHRLTLPGEITETNADRVEGSTVIWDLGDGGSTSMTAESVVYRWAVIGGVAAGGGIVLLALAGLAVWLLVRRRRAAGAAPADASVTETEASAGTGGPAPLGGEAVPALAAGAHPLPPAQVPELPSAVPALPAAESRLLSAAGEDTAPSDEDT